MATVVPRFGMLECNRAIAEELLKPSLESEQPAAVVLDLVGKQDRLYFAPGSQFRYSNTGYALLALIVEKVSGRSFAQFLEKNIFDPLGMASTGFQVATKDLHRLATN